MDGLELRQLVSLGPDTGLVEHVRPARAMHEVMELAGLHGTTFQGDGFHVSVKGCTIICPPTQACRGRVQSGRVHHPQPRDVEHDSQGNFRLAVPPRCGVGDKNLWWHILREATVTIGRR